MEALRVQRPGHGGNAGRLTRADSPVGGASTTVAFVGGARADQSGLPGLRCLPVAEAAALPDTTEPAEASQPLEAPGPAMSVEASMPAGRSVPGETVDAAVTLSSGSTAAIGLREAIAVVNAAAVAAPGALAMAGYVEAADFADMAEELSRTVEYLQILGAGAVDRTRTQAI
ncbi:MAG TPA: hypothetical protein VJ617_05200, partial [Arthrobacter sp.]|nr:hypothetical protein [Arthrobacter sp.]